MLRLIALLSKDQSKTTGLLAGCCGLVDSFVTGDLNDSMRICVQSMDVQSNTACLVSVCDACPLLDGPFC